MPCDEKQKSLTRKSILCDFFNKNGNFLYVLKTTFAEISDEAIIATNPPKPKD